MKQKILIFLAFSLLSFCWFSSAQTISLAVSWSSTLGNNCLVPVNVYIDTAGETISATDLMMETSLEYKDFVPTSMFPYYLPPVVRSNGLLHIVWFTVDDSERVNGSWFLGTIYFIQKPWFTDGTVRMYFLEEWATIDSNLSKVWGVDTLKQVGYVNVTFSRDMPSCSHEAATIVTWWFEGVSYQESLDTTMQKIYDKYGKFSLSLFLQNNIFFVIAFFLLILIILLVIYRKNLLSSFQKDAVWKKHTS